MRLLLVVVAVVLVTSSLLSSAMQDRDLDQVQMEHISYGVGFYQGNEIRMGLKVDGIEADRRERLPKEKLVERQVWRDRRLMALAAHKRRADDEIGN